MTTDEKRQLHKDTKAWLDSLTEEERAKLSREGPTPAPWSEDHRQGFREGCRLQYRVSCLALQQVREGRSPEDVEGKFGEELRALLRVGGWRK